MRSRPHFYRDLATVLAGLAAATFIFVGSLGLAGDLPGGKSERIRAVLPTTSALSTGSRVTMAGAPVGRVTDVTREGYGTVVDLEIRDSSVLPIPDDSRVTLRQRTPVGEIYLEITPGKSARSLPADGTLPIQQTNEYVDVDQVLSVLKGPARAAARDLIQGTGEAVAGQGPQLNRTLGDASSVVRHGAGVLSLLSEDRQHLASLIDRFGRIADAVGERGAALQALADRGLHALRAVGARDQALAATLRELPGTLRQVRGTSTRLRATSAAAAPVLSDAAAAVRDLQPAVSALRPAAQQGRNAVRELDRSAAPITSLLGEAGRASGPIATALPQMLHTICQVAPVFRYARPYAKDLLAPIIGLGSAANSYDAIGHLIRLTPIVNENYFVGMPKEVSQAAYTLLRAGIIGKSSELTWDPYPKPNAVGVESASDKPGIYGPKALGETGYKFPHVTADC